MSETSGPDTKPPVDFGNLKSLNISLTSSYKGIVISFSFSGSTKTGS